MRPKDPPFEPRPSLQPAVGFLVKNVKRYPDEICQKCKNKAFPDDPTEAIHNENAAAHIERVYCSHVYVSKVSFRNSQSNMRLIVD